MQNNLAWKIPSEVQGGGGGGSIGGTISAGQVAFGSALNTIAGTFSLFWDNATERLGIGTALPTAKLHIKKGAGAGGDIVDPNATVKIESDSNANNVWVNMQALATNGSIGFAIAGTLKGCLTYNATNNFIALSNSSSGAPTTGFIVSTSNKLGLNQNNPIAPVQYANNIFSGDTYDGGGGWASNRVAQVMTDGTVRCSWQTQAAFGANFGTETNHNLRFFTNNADVMMLDANGNVGVGTITPGSKLAVVGLPIYANNAAAVGGGLAAGDFYRTGGDPDTVCVVH